ncbi:hypothetical protein CA260_07565 [Dyella jiangningensis]|uniref:Uncharacterized protein n=1 Tax=Dyella jiangningensis TaxID=1379159 RepID=A0A328P7R7_9GAMM|nr:hypothetical protein CA260_07565 [Dyella jiangningensis]
MFIPLLVDQTGGPEMVQNRSMVLHASASQHGRKSWWVETRLFFCRSAPRARPQSHDITAP